jgi:preprotein translocase subunit YajC
MFRKITSNRDPDKTLGSELKKEFGIYYEQVIKRSRQVMEKYPRQIFSIMIMAILFSGVMAFTVMREQPKSVRQINVPSQNVTTGLGDIVSTANTLQALMATQKQVDLLLKKDTLSHSDSLTLNLAIVQMESLRDLIKKSRPNH